MYLVVSNRASFVEAFSLKANCLQEKKNDVYQEN